MLYDSNWLLLTLRYAQFNLKSMRFEKNIFIQLPRKIPRLFNPINTLISIERLILEQFDVLPVSISSGQTESHAPFRTESIHSFWSKIFKNKGIFVFSNSKLTAPTVANLRVHFRKVLATFFNNLKSISACVNSIATSPYFHFDGSLASDIGNS